MCPPAPKACDACCRPCLLAGPPVTPPPACTSNAVWRSLAWGAGPSCPHEQPDCTLEQASSCPPGPGLSSLMPDFTLFLLLPPLMRRADSLEKTLMLGKVEGRRRKGQ